MNIVLFGFMGTGKSAVGRCLAERAELRFVDMDDEVERKEGASIPALFADKGEAYFRQVEAAVAVELGAADGLVVATGGGVVLNPSNLTAFTGNGICVCLRAVPETILHRIREQTHRPLLQQPDREQRVRQLLHQRKHFYDAIPHQVQTDGLSVEDVAAQILKLV